jgi:F0F1-type ATP synthase membrane subunit c/vacuolar-type H+-ATPase subunit K
MITGSIAAIGAGLAAIGAGLGIGLYCSSTRSCL